MTLRGRLIWMLFLTLIPLGVGVGVGLYAFVRSSLMARLDETLVARAEALAAMFEAKHGDLEFEFAQEAMSQYQARSPNARDAAGFEVYRLKDGALDKLVQRSPSLGDQSLLGGRPLPSLATSWNGHLSGDLDIRVLAKRLPVKVEREEQAESGRIAIDPEVLVVVAMSREAVDKPVDTLVAALAGAGVLILAVGWISVRWAISRGLAPVNHLAQQVTAIDPANLGSRLHTERLPAEIAPIQERMNALLERMDAAMQREKRFTSAAAHELRTPVAELRTLLEVAALRPRSAEESAQTMSAAGTIVERLHGLVAAMLHLTRIESGRESVELSSVSLSSVVQEAVEGARAIAAARSVRFQVAVDQRMTVRCDTGLFNMVVGNVVANAAEYADEGSEVSIAASVGPNGTVLRITNRATTLVGINQARIGEPLWRPDPARSHSGHLGLGISLARAALTAMGGTIAVSVASAELPQFVVEILVPMQ